MIASVSVVYPYSCLADWELWLTTSAQHLKRVSFCILLARTKVKIQNLKQFRLIMYGFCTMVKLKNPTSKLWEVGNHLYSIRYWKRNTFTYQLVGLRSLSKWDIHFLLRRHCLLPSQWLISPKIPIFFRSHPLPSSSYDSGEADPTSNSRASQLFCQGLKNLGLC